MQKHGCPSPSEQHKTCIQQEHTISARTCSAATRAGTSSGFTRKLPATDRTTPSSAARCSAAARPATASMRRTPLATPLSLSTLKAPTSAVLDTWVPVVILMHMAQVRGRIAGHHQHHQSSQRRKALATTTDRWYGSCATNSTCSLHICLPTYSHPPVYTINPQRSLSAHAQQHHHS
jgi:hypothetical protein